MQTINRDYLPSEEELEDFFTDTSVTDWHYRLVESALGIARGIPEVEAVFLMGSLGKGEGDIFSDVDFYMVHGGDNDEEAAASIRHQFIERINEIGDVIHSFSSTFNPKDAIVYFKPFVKFEMGIKSIDAASESWKSPSCKLLFDRNGLGRKAMQSASGICFDLNEHTAELRNAAIACPSFCYITAACIVRGEHVTAMFDLDWVRAYLLKVSGWFLGIWDEGPRRAEQRFPAEVLDYFNRSAAADVDSIWNSVDVILDWYANWLVPKFEQNRIPHTLHEVPRIRWMFRKLRQQSE